MLSWRHAPLDGMCVAFTLDIFTLQHAPRHAAYALNRPPHEVALTLYNTTPPRS